MDPILKSCIACGSDLYDSLYKSKDYLVSQHNFQLVTCKKCKLVRTIDAPSPSDAGQYYQSEDYISHSDSRDSMMDKVYHFVRRMMLKKKSKMIQKHVDGTSILDLGCGTGYFLHHMSNNGYHGQGIEIDSSARQTGIQKFGVDIQSPDVFLSKKLSSKYDAITMWHVLEHIYELPQYLTTIRHYLKSSGRLFVAVPNISSWDSTYYKQDWAALDVPRHLWHFNPETMHYLMHKNGFEIVDHKSLPFDPFYVSLLSEIHRGGGPLRMIRGLIVGFISFLLGSVYVKNASSIVYVLKKHGKQ